MREGRVGEGGSRFIGKILVDAGKKREKELSFSGYCFLLVGGFCAFFQEKLVCPEYEFKVSEISTDGYTHTLLEEIRLMQCPRCRGTMIVDHFVDMAASGEIWMPGWRCLMCGEIIDPLIEQHRQQQCEHREIVSAISGSTARPPSPISVKPRKAT